MLPFLHQNNTAFNSYHKINYLEVACTFFSGNVSRYFRGEGHWTKCLFTSKQCKHSRGLYWKEDLEDMEESPALAGNRTYNPKTRRPPHFHCATVVALTGKKCSPGSIFYGPSIARLRLTDGCRCAVGQHESGIKASVLDQESWQVTERWKFEIAFQNFVLLRLLAVLKVCDLFQEWLNFF